MEASASVPAKSLTPFSGLKVLQHCDRIGAWQNEQWYAPIQVELDLTNRCQSRCPFCAGFEEREDRPYDLFDGNLEMTIDLLVNLSKLGVRSLTFTGGGDPTMHRDWLDIVSLASATGMKLGMVTNGEADPTPALPHLEWIRFSVDAATPEVYLRTHGRAENRFRQVIANVTKVAHNKGNCTVGVGFLTHDKWSGDIIPFVEMWRDVPVDYIQYRPLLNAFGAEWFNKNQKHILMLINHARKLDPRVKPSDQKYNDMRNSGRTERCHGAMFETAIAADGKVYACCHHKGLANWAIGDLNHESFQAVWTRHLKSRSVTPTDQCPLFCRHYATNKLFERMIDVPTMHKDFI